MFHDRCDAHVQPPQSGSGTYDADPGGRYGSASKRGGGKCAERYHRLKAGSGGAADQDIPAGAGQQDHHECPSDQQGRTH